MSYQAGPIEELIQYKKAVLQDDRRDSRIRSSIENTLEFISKRQSQFSSKAGSIISSSGSTTQKVKMTYPQGQQYPPGTYPPQLSNETTARNSTDGISDSGKGFERNIYPGDHRKTYDQNTYPMDDRRTYEPARPYSEPPNSPPNSYPEPPMPYPSDNGDRRTLQPNPYPSGSSRRTYQQSNYPPPMLNDGSVLGRQLTYEKQNDLEVQSVSLDMKKEIHEEHEHEEPTSLPLRQRLKHFTWAWYAMTMSTGGVAFTLSVLPNRFSGLDALGAGIFILNLFLFTFVTITQITRWFVHPGTFVRSFTNPHEGFFFATFWLTLATMMTNTTAYAIGRTGPWIIDALRIAFWLYTLCATLVAIFIYYIFFHNHALVITNVLPGWVLPIFPAMLVGTLASAISKTQPAEHAVPMLVAGLSFQGLGIILSIGMYGIYFGRLMTSGLPADMSRPAMFIAVGPPSFTALAFIGMANDVKVLNLFGPGGYTVLLGIDNQALIPDMLNLFALMSAIFLWVLAFWFFGIAFVAAIEAIHRNDFHLNWYAYVFPNVGFTIATIQIGNKLESSGIQMVGTGMGVILSFLWIAIAGAHIKAFVTNMICFPHRDEDAH